MTGLTFGLWDVLTGLNAGHLDKEIWQFDAMEAMAESILLDRKYQLLTWLHLVFPNHLITRLRQHLMWMIAILLLCFGSSCGGDGFHGW